MTRVSDSTVLITGSSGLIGSEAVELFEGRRARVHGVDNNLRAEFFGPEGDTLWNLARLREACPGFVHHELDIRDRAGVLRLVETVRPDLVVHAAAQPSHDLAAGRPFDDFDVNAVGTLNVLEATRRFAGDAVFLHMSTNKVYGDAPNRLPLVELETRWEYARDEDWEGIDEHCPIDQSLHSVFGASKTAADVMVQEYGRYYGLRTTVFRGGCLTGSRHSGAKLHGFLNYLFRTAVEGRPYTVLGYKGKQVRDQIHSEDVVSAMLAVYENPRAGEVYNLGGGRANSASVLECITLAEAISGRPLQWSYRDEPRKGDHICYITDMRKFREHYPEWEPAWSLERICEDLWATLSREGKANVDVAGDGGATQAASRT